MMPTPTKSVPPTHTLDLILGDQLNLLHPWFAQVDVSGVYVLMETQQAKTNA